MRSPMKELLIVTTVAAVCLGCAPAERSAAGALENAGSVLRHGADKLWIEENTAKNGQKEEERDELAMPKPIDENRY